MSRTVRNKSYRATWRGKGLGKYWKRKLHKARRRFAKGHGKEPTHYESEVNWKAD